MLISLAIAFQIQCGIQQIGTQSLAYGVLIYTSPQTPSPQLAYFEQYTTGFKEHPFCSILKDKMNGQQTLDLHLSDDGKKILNVR